MLIHVAAQAGAKLCDLCWALHLLVHMHVTWHQKACCQTQLQNQLSCPLCAYRQCSTECLHACLLLGLSADLQSQMPLYTLLRLSLTCQAYLASQMICNVSLYLASVPGTASWNEIVPLMAVMPFRCWRFGYKLVPTPLILPGTHPLPR